MSDRWDQGEQHAAGSPPVPPPYRPGPDPTSPPLTGPSEIPAYLPPPSGAYGVVDDRRPTPPPAPPQLRYADWGERVGATLVDWALIMAPFFIIAIVAPDSTMLEDLTGLLWLAAAGWVAWLNGAKGQSPGKALMGIKLVRDVDASTLGGPVGVARAIVLTLMAVFTGGIAWFLSLLWPLWDKKNQTLHDKIFSATVVAGYPRAKFGKAIFRA